MKCDSKTQHLNTSLMWILPSTADVLFIALLLAMMFGSAKGYFVRDGDTGWHIRAGQYMIEHHTIPHKDIFSFTMPESWWVAYEWGTEVIMALFDRLAGLNGMTLMIMFVIASSYTLLYRFLRRDGYSFVFSMSLMLFVVAGSGFHWAARPHPVSYLFAIIFFRMLDRFTRGEIQMRQVWLLPPLMLLWVNLHAGFIAGCILLLTFLGCALLRFLTAIPSQHETEKRLLKTMTSVSIAGLIATLLNPYGFGMYIYLFRYFRAVHHINPYNELHSPTFQITGFQPFLFLLVMLIFLLRYSLHRPTLEECTVLASWSALGLISARNIPVMFLICTPIIARLLDGVKQPLGDLLNRLPRFLDLSRRVIAHIERVVAIEHAFKGHFFAIAVGALLWIAALNGGRLGTAQLMNFNFEPSLFPTGAIPFLRSHMPEGNGFNEWGAGGFLIYEFYPHIKVFVDGRLDFYGQKFTTQYMDLIGNPDHVNGSESWKSVFARYQIQWALVSQEQPLRIAMAADPDWKTEYQDKTCVVFKRLK